MINIITEEEKKLKKYKDSVFIILAIQEYFIKYGKLLKPKDQDHDETEDNINKENLLKLLFGDEIDFIFNSFDENVVILQHNHNKDS